MANKQRVLALGFFDGVHMGHGELLKRTMQVAKELKATPAVLTFDTHPEDLIVGMPTLLINSRRDREYIVKRYYGIEEVLLMHFDQACMHMSWQKFIENMIVRDYNAVHVVAGHDFRFGYKGIGNPQRLKDKCFQLDIGCDIIPCVEYDGTRISSTYIRKLIAQGDIERANILLGHPHTLSGEVVHGRQLGRTMGIPTINMYLPEGVLSPCHGVYATRVHIGEKEYMGVTNVGVRPTVDGDNSTRVSVETYILDYSGNLYGQILRIDFYKFLRPEIHFRSMDDLKSEIQNNIHQTREFFSSYED